VEENFKNRSHDPEQAPFGVTHHPLYSTHHGLSTKEKTKCLASAIQKLLRGPKI